MAVFLLVILILPTPCPAWGAEGHCIAAAKCEQSAGNPEQWAKEAHWIGQQEIYSRITRQGGTEYARLDSAVSAQQLEREGVRLATVLTAALR